MQQQSISTAYLADTVLSIVHQLYGKDGQQYKSNPAIFLPGYEPEDKDEQPKLDPSPETIKILLTALKERKLHGLVFAHVAEYIAEWSAEYA